MRAVRHLRHVGKDCLVAFDANLHSVLTRRVRGSTNGPMGQCCGGRTVKTGSYKHRSIGWLKAPKCPNNVAE